MSPHLRDRRRWLWSLLSATPTAPTVRELMAWTGCRSFTQIYDDLRCLERLGYIQLPGRQRQRAIRVVVPYLLGELRTEEPPR